MKLPNWEQNLPNWQKLVKLPKVKNMKQFSQSSWGKGQGFWGSLAPKVSPMQQRKKGK